MLKSIAHRSVDYYLAAEATVGGVSDAENATIGVGDASHKLNTQE